MNDETAAERGTLAGRGDKKSTIIKLQKGSAGCGIKEPTDKLRVKKGSGDKLTWTVNNNCDEQHTVELRFDKGDASPLDPACALSVTVPGKDSKDFSCTVRKDAGPASGEKGYNYSVWIDGGRAEDPQIEIYN